MENTQSVSFFERARQFLNQTPPDYAVAVPLLRQAVQKGDTEAAFQLSGCLMNGLGVRKNAEEGIALLEQAASAGHPYARYNLLQLKEAGGTPVALLLGVYGDLAEQGMVQAQMRLLKYFNETGKTDKALYWAKKAAAANHPQAQYYLAQYYQNAAEPDMEAAYRLYRQAAEQGLVAAHWQLGLQYLYGQGVPQNHEQAARYLRIAAEQGIAAAQTALAEILLPENSKEALVWFQTASEQGDNNAHAALAELYLLGRYVERNSEAARSHAEAAAQFRHPEALRLLGDIYSYGLGVDADSDTARGYYRQAAEAGSMAAYQKLVSDSALHDRQNYKRIKETALQHQKLEQLYQQAFASYHGLNQMQDYSEAFEFYLQAAKLGHRRAQTDLGMMYYSGKGVEEDTAQAAYWFGCAAESNDATAQYSLACLYFNGEGIERNIAKACALLEVAICNGHPHKDALIPLLNQWREMMSSLERPSEK